MKAWFDASGMMSSRKDGVRFTDYIEARFGIGHSTISEAVRVIDNSAPRPAQPAIPDFARCWQQGPTRITNHGPSYGLGFRTTTQIGAGEIKRPRHCIKTERSPGLVRRQTRDSRPPGPGPPASSCLAVKAGRAPTHASAGRHRFLPHKITHPQPSVGAGAELASGDSGPITPALSKPYSASVI